MEGALHPDLKLLADFFLQQRASLPEAYTHAPGLISSPTFFSVERLQEHLNNPLLTPNWISLMSRGEIVSLEPAFLVKVVQAKELFFMDKEFVNEHLRRGAALLLEGLDILEPSINAFVAQLDSALPCALGECVAFFSQRDNEAYAGHCDADDVLVIHLEGEKTWRLYERQQRRYVNNAPLTREQLGPQIRQLVMRPGDAMYLRAGVPHACQTTGEYSLHLSFDLRDRTPSVKQITQEANTRYDTACADPHSPAANVVDTYVALLKSEKFQRDLALATQRIKGDAITFRERIAKVSAVHALSRFKKRTPERLS